MVARDFHDRLRERLARALGSAMLAEALSRELSRIRCAFFFRRLGREQASRSPQSAGARVFTIHERSGYGGVLVALGLASVVEMTVAHLLLRPAHPLLSDALFLGGAYGIVWLFGDYQAVRLRPFLVDGNTLHLRVGVRRELSMPLSNVRATDALPTGGEPSPSSGYARFTAVGAPEMLLRLRSPVTVAAGGQRPRAISTLGITVDDDAAFRAAVLAGSSTNRTAA